MDIFTKTYNQIIAEIISPGIQATFRFPKLTKLGFKIKVPIHVRDRDIERNVTKGNEDWFFKQIDDVISNALTTSKFEDDKVVFSLFTKYDDLTQIPIEVDFKRKETIILTLINVLTPQRVERLLSLGRHYDEKGRLVIPIKC